MFRLWGKLWKDNHLLKDTVICDDSEDTRTHKIFRGLESICYEMDLGNPIWLESTVRHFKKHGKARFYQDNFIEQIDFDGMQYMTFKNCNGDFSIMQFIYENEKIKAVLDFERAKYME